LQYCSDPQEERPDVRHAGRGRLALPAGAGSGRDDRRYAAR